MSLASSYADLAAVRTALGYTTPDTGDDTRVRSVLEAVSRFVDNHTARHFFVQTATRTFTAVNGAELLLPYDLLAITTLKTDEDDDWDYDYTWDTGDYHLYPFNEFPKYAIRTKSGGQYSLPSQEEGVQIVGSWGYGDGENATPWALSGATVSVATVAGTTVVASSGAAFKILQTILAGTEQMYITNIATNDLTVVRGVNGTTAAIQGAGTAASIARYPGPVTEATVLQAARLMRRGDAPFGVTGSGEMGQSFVISRLDPDVRFLLEPYRRLVVA